MTIMTFYEELMGDMSIVLPIKHLTDRVTVLYGKSGSGKTKLCVDLIKRFGREKIFSEFHCWSTTSTIAETEYSLFFGPKNCHTNFSKFNEWFTSKIHELEQIIPTKKKMITNQSFINGVIPFMPPSSLNIMENKLAAVGNIAEKRELIIDIWYALIMQNKEHIMKTHQPHCLGMDKCSVCHMCLDKRVLLLLDDFATKKDFVMKGDSKFVNAPMQSRHVHLTILVLAQSIDLIPMAFRVNTNIAVFTEIGSLSEYISMANIFVSLIKKQELMNVFESAKKKNRWAFLVWSSVVLMDEVSMGCLNLKDNENETIVCLY